MEAYIISHPPLGLNKENPSKPKNYPPAHIPAYLLVIGEFKVTSSESELMAKCYYARQNFAWEILDKRTMRKYKIEVPWENILAIRVSTHEMSQGFLEIELGKEPNFYQEAEQNSHTRNCCKWELAQDFTRGHALKYRRHKLMFDAEILKIHYKRMMESSRLFQLSQQPFPSLESPIFHAIHVHHRQPQQAPQPYAHFPAYLLTIGEFKIVGAFESSDLVATCHYATRKLAWEMILDKSIGRKYKIEISWEDISAIRVTAELDMPGHLEIELRKDPKFYQETHPKSGCNGMWESSFDFTNGHVLIQRKHRLVFPIGVLNKLYASLIHSEPRFLPLTQQIPCSDYSLLYSKLLNTNGDKHIEGNDQVNNGQLVQDSNTNIEERFIVNGDANMAPMQPEPNPQDFWETLSLLERDLMDD